MKVFISPRAPQCEALFLESKRALYLVNTFDEFLYAYGGQRMQLGAWPQSCMAYVGLFAIKMQTSFTAYLHSVVLL